MAASQHDFGSKAATLDTEHVLNATTPETTDGVFQFFVDLSVLALGDIVVLKVKEKCTGSGDTQRIAWREEFAHVQGKPLAVSPSLILLHGWDFTLEQTDGTARTFLWSIRKA